MTREVILDTSFILSAIRKKIDFLDDASSQGLTPVVPKQVMFELEKIPKDESKIALKILKKNRVRVIDLNTKDTDNGIIAYANANPEIIVATLDTEIKNSVKNPKFVIRGKKRLEII